MNKNSHFSPGLKTILATLHLPSTMGKFQTTPQPIDVVLELRVTSTTIFLRVARIAATEVCVMRTTPVRFGVIVQPSFRESSVSWKLMIVWMLIQLDFKIQFLDRFVTFSIFSSFFCFLFFSFSKSSAVWFEQLLETTRPAHAVKTRYAKIKPASPSTSQTSTAAAPKTTKKPHPSISGNLKNTSALKFRAF